MFRKSLMGIAAAIFIVVMALSFAPPKAHAGASTSTLINKYYGALLQGTTFTAETNLFVGLCTGTITPGTACTEVSTSSTGYARAEVASNTTNWVVTSGVAGNGTAITFPAPTGSWGTVSGFFLADASTAGNILVVAALTTPQTISAGQAAPSFGAGSSVTYTISKLIGVQRFMEDAANDGDFARLMRKAS